MTKRRRRMGVLFAGAAIPLCLASVAYACAVLATLSVNPEKGRRGAIVTGTGANYCADPTCTPVTVHFKNRTGPVLAEVRPGPDRRIAFEFAVPKAAPGWYSIVAVQKKADGSPVAGTPGRDSFKVLGTRTTNRGETAPVWSSKQNPPESGAAASSGIHAPVSSETLLTLALVSFALTVGLGVYWKATGKLNPTVTA